MQIQPPSLCQEQVLSTREEVPSKFLESAQVFSIAFSHEGCSDRAVVPG